jgi:hypothetical protein
MFGEPTVLLVEISVPFASQKHMNADLAGTGRLFVAAADEEDAVEYSDEPLPAPRREGASLK